MDEGLRARKKRETRAALSTIATKLFTERGFDAVTVNDVAQAANVSKMTVFNYFARKEDLFFDREPEGIELLETTLRERGNKKPIAALRAAARRLVDTHHAFARFQPSVIPFWNVVVGSPALQARMRELADEIVTALATMLADSVGRAPDDEARLIASLLVAGWRASYRAALAALQLGQSSKRCAALFETLLDRAHAGIRVVAKGTPY